MREIYGVPDSEMELLPLGADMDLIEETQSRCDRDALRAELGIGPEDFVIFTGGKITPRKRTEDIRAAIDTSSLDRAHALLPVGVPAAQPAYPFPLRTAPPTPGGPS